MAGEDHEHRLSTIEANYSHLTDSMGRMEGYLSKLFDQQGDIKTSLALVVQNQNGMTEYQKRCDAERTDHEKRITSVEGFQGRMIKAAIAVTGIGSLASPQLAKVWARIFS